MDSHNCLQHCFLFFVNHKNVKMEPKLQEKATKRQAAQFPCLQHTDINTVLIPLLQLNYEVVKKCKEFHVRMSKPTFNVQYSPCSVAIWLSNLRSNFWCTTELQCDASKMQHCLGNAPLKLEGHRRLEYGPTTQDYQLLLLYTSPPALRHLPRCDDAIARTVMPDVSQAHTYDFPSSGTAALLLVLYQWCVVAVLLGVGLFTFAK